VEGSLPDVRSDIFSCGALLYHLTTGRRPFRGATISDTWTAILKDEPQPIEQITSRAPKGMAKLIERCLRKNPQRRFQQIAEIGPLLEQMVDAYYENPDNKISFIGRNRGRIAKIGGIALAATACVAATVFWWQKAPAREPIIGSQLRQVTNHKGFETDPALSPDGSQLAYASDRNGDGNLDIWVQPAGGGEPRPVTSDPADDHEPAFSPDGEAIAFRSERNGGGIYRVSAKGGAAQLIAPEGRRPRYSPDGRWIAYWLGPPGFAPKSNGAYKVFVVPAGGGAPREFSRIWPSAPIPFGRLTASSCCSPAGRTPLDPARTQSTGGSRRSKGSSYTVPALHEYFTAKAFSRTINSNPGDWRGNHIYFAVPAPSGSSIWRADASTDNHVVSARPVRVTSGKASRLSHPPGAAAMSSSPRSRTTRHLGYSRKCK